MQLVQDTNKWGVFAIDYRQISCDASVSCLLRRILVEYH